MEFQQTQPLTNTEDLIDLRKYFFLLRHWAWLLILCSLLAGTAAYLVSSHMTPVYQASSKLLISEPVNSKQSDYTSLLTSERLAATYVEMITNHVVLQQTIEVLGLPLSPEQLKEKITANVIHNTQLIEISVESTDPQLAADILNVLIGVFNQSNKDLQSKRFSESKNTLQQQISGIEDEIANIQNVINNLGSSEEDTLRRSQLETTLTQYKQTYANLLQSIEEVQLTEAQSTSNIYQIEPANVPTKPVRPRILMNTLLAAVVGGMLAVGAIFLMEAMNTAIQTPEEALTLFQLPVIGFIPDIAIRSNGSGPVIEPRSPAAESYRTLRANLELSTPDNPPKVILVTSPTPAQGKSFTAFNLAKIIAQANKRVVLVDADLRKPTIHKLLKVSNRTGLTTLFRRDTTTNQVIRFVESNNLGVITSGPLPPNPLEILSSQKMGHIINQLRKAADFIIIDSPPALVSDPTYLGKISDGVILIVNPGKTDRQAIKDQILQIQRLTNCNILGLVFNRVSQKGYYGYKYYSYIKYSDA